MGHKLYSVQMEVTLVEHPVDLRGGTPLTRRVVSIVTASKGAGVRLFENVVGHSQVIKELADTLSHTEGTIQVHEVSKTDAG